MLTSPSPEGSVDPRQTPDADPTSAAPAPPGGSSRYMMMVVSGLVALGLGLGAAALPVPYVVESAGPTFNTLGQDGDKPVITVSGHETYPAKGNLDLTTVLMAGGPKSPASIYDLFRAWLDKSKAVYPEELIYPKGTTAEQTVQQGEIAMETSQENAVAAALRELDIPFEQRLTVAGLSDGSPSSGKLQEGDRLLAINGKAITSMSVVQAELSAGAGAPVVVGIDRNGSTTSVTVTPTKNASDRYVLGVLLSSDFTFPFDVKISLDNVGGPSAGMMFALGIVDTLTPGDLTGGRHVAGTGTITADGAVGPIGGVAQKMIGARQHGATMFLAPAANCADVVGNVPDGLQVVKVETLADAKAAVERLGSGQDTSGLPTCANN
ncbi:PDZ domain-containing protein [Arthrobacter sp. TES]|uniref:endopeptidase La n=1 Tax=Paenarthrobacter ureafaciens TaxID=37931 RepID=A0AAX3EEA8_PAEUR|nr:MULTISPECIES: S16 family serine protease [Paenarthrobacter]AMB41098.1 signal protein PDZ [Arthrobacter sp. ATCC 21022]AOY70514.1 signal protein PDZ [Arthrobacter sp. ZXY-2]ERI38236.1 signal protein PDZ [Arthrobacter sp. AK-YN10]NKR10313.1 signal protein PDZ [Arthrobacter sp. M5]NKR16975.1 signal protein PDZ [Arthrobacter sp. M6]OEH62689.1 signal protein PDZ [Arthrobacter sp. D4]OEH63260.1 signal protein PDZ [Arthrobacter sp. D2]QOI62720.1 PDZ domain-containing protein [Arthrobacter sp. T